MENIAQRCEAFAKKIHCELNNTAKECEEGKTVMIKYCSKECTGIFEIDFNMSSLAVRTEGC